MADLRHIRSVLLSYVNDAFIVNLSYSFDTSWFMAKEGFYTSFRVASLESDHHVYWFLSCFDRVSQWTCFIVGNSELGVFVEYLTVR